MRLFVTDINLPQYKVLVELKIISYKELVKMFNNTALMYFMATSCYAALLLIPSYLTKYVTSIPLEKIICANDTCVWTKTLGIPL